MRRMASRLREYATGAGPSIYAEALTKAALDLEERAERLDGEAIN
jgi:hypothetical protein